MLCGADLKSEVASIKIFIKVHKVILTMYVERKQMILINSLIWQSLICSVVILCINLYLFSQGIYVTEVHDKSPASKSGLRVHDKILQCNGYDFTMVSIKKNTMIRTISYEILYLIDFIFQVTHKKAVSYIRKHPVLNLLVARKGVTST